MSSSTISGSGNIDELRLYPAIAEMSTQTFEPLIGVTSQCGPNSQLLYYEYDGLNRLVYVKDDDGNIVKNFKYNYGLGSSPTASSQTLFYNQAAQQNFTKAGCGSLYGQVVTYVIPYGKHASSISQSDANQKATDDMQNNGQAYANAVGVCLWGNAAVHEMVYKNDCLPEQGPGLGIWFDIPAGTFKSALSLADANQQAN